VAGQAKRPILQSKERGAALMIVLLFAAILAITLYQAVPRAVFEARRAKEQLLIDRGNQYVRAIQLYYRKFRPQYPPSIEALEDTNRMRFLRHRYKDPFTGKDDWRLLHTNGITLTDSKVNLIKTTGKQSDSKSNSASGWFTNSTSAFGGNSTSFSDTSSSSSDEQPEVKVPPVRKRPPEIPANAGPAQSADSLNQFGGDLNAQLHADLASEPSLLGSEEQTAAPQSQGSTAPAGAQQTGSQDQNQPNPMQMVRNMLSSEAPRTPPQPGMVPGAVHGGGIAGVASRAAGKSIKVVNDQDDYSLWEFVYDPTKDRTGAPVIPGRAPSSAEPVAEGTTTPPK
jgi:type II secretory pathway pseudopilin PulG